MLKYTTVANGDELTVIPKGKLDTNTSPQFKKDIDKEMSNYSRLLIDMEHLIYISSAGLRVILSYQKSLGAGLTVKNVSEDNMTIFKMTGLSNVLKII